MPYRDVGHLILSAGWLHGLGMLCYVYACTRHVIWDDARDASSYGGKLYYIRLCAATCDN